MPERVVRAGASPAEDERDPEWDRCRRIREVVRGVGQQRDAAGEREDRQLQHGGGPEAREPDFGRPDSALMCLERRGRLTVGVMVGNRHQVIGAMQKGAKPSARLGGVVVILGGWVAVVAAH